jgi:hypothetical protein
LAEHRDRLQNHPREKKKKKKLTVIPNFLLTEIWQHHTMTTYALKISSCVHTFSNRILTFMSSVHLFMSYIHTFSNGVLTFMSSIHTVTSRFHTFTSRVQTLSPRSVHTFTSRVQTFLPRVHTFTSRVLTFSSSAHTFASIGLVGYEVGSRLFFYWRNFAKSQNEMRKIDFYSILEVFNRQK